MFFNCPRVPLYVGIIRRPLAEVLKAVVRLHQRPGIGIASLHKLVRLELVLKQGAFRLLFPSANTVFNRVERLGLQFEGVLPPEFAPLRQNRSVVVRGIEIAGVQRLPGAPQHLRTGKPLHLKRPGKGSCSAATLLLPRPSPLLSRADREVFYLLIQLLRGTHHGAVQTQSRHGIVVALLRLKLLGTFPGVGGDATPILELIESELHRRPQQYHP